MHSTFLAGLIVSNLISLFLTFYISTVKYASRRRVTALVCAGLLGPRKRRHGHHLISVTVCIIWQTRHKCAVVGNVTVVTTYSVFTNDECLSNITVVGTRLWIQMFSLFGSWCTLRIHLND